MPKLFLAKMLLRVTLLLGCAAHATCLCAAAQQSASRNILPSIAKGPTLSADAVIRLEVLHTVASDSARAQSVLRVGEPLWIKASLINQGTEPLGIEMFDPADDFQIQVREENGKRVPLTRLGKIIEPFSSDSDPMLQVHAVSRARGRVNPGKEIHRSYQLTTTFDMTIIGTYTIVVSRKLLGGQLVVSQPLRVSLEPESVPVESDAPSDDDTLVVFGNGRIIPKYLLGHYAGLYEWVYSVVDLFVLRNTVLPNPYKPVAKLGAMANAISHDLARPK